jgi:dCTP deaminase
MIDIPAGRIVDEDIVRLCSDMEMITPFSDTIQNAVQGHDGASIKQVSYGVSSAGYDFRLSPYILVSNRTVHQIAEHTEFFNNRYPTFDVKNVSEIDHFTRIDLRKEPDYKLPPHRFMLGCTMEDIWLPDDVIVEFTGKSTWARAGLMVFPTPVEPSFKGSITLEFFNANSDPLQLYHGEGICQGMFYKLPKRPAVTYSDRSGKYMNQASGQPTLPRV